MPLIDVHQRLPGEPLGETLARRAADAGPSPRRLDLRVAADAGPSPRRLDLQVAAESDSVLTVEATDAESRREELGEDGIDRALVPLSTALGISMPAAPLCRSVPPRPPPATTPTVARAAAR